MKYVGIETDFGRYKLVNSKVIKKGFIDTIQFDYTKVDPLKIEFNSRDKLFNWIGGKNDL